MSKHTELGIRMKMYEETQKYSLMKRVPVIIRLDGKAFHTYTRGLNKPFDENLMEDMQNTAIFLCENIQGAKCAYVQSDEISLLLTDFDTFKTQAWFHYELSKMESISAAYATARFNQLRSLRLSQEIRFEEGQADYINIEVFENMKLAYFDSRARNYSKEEVSNYFLWRQQDAIRNSISMLAQSLYSPKELHGKNVSDMQEMCFQKEHNWNDLHWSKKRGTFIIRNTYVNGHLADDMYPFNKQEGDIERSKWEAVETPFKFDYSHFEQWL